MGRSDAEGRRGRDVIVAKQEAVGRVGWRKRVEVKVGR